MLRLLSSMAILSLCFLMIQSQTQQTGSMLFQTTARTFTPNGVRSCASNPCLNGGLCVDHSNGFACKCQYPWTGRICNFNQRTAATFTRSLVKRQAGSGCAGSPCKNGGTCYDFGEDTVCVCQYPWSGDTCQENLENPNPVTTSRTPTTAVFVTTAQPATTMGIQTTARPATTMGIQTTARPATTMGIQTTAQPATTMGIQTTARPATTMIMQTTARPATTMVMQTTARLVTGTTTPSRYTSCSQSPCRNGGTCVPRDGSYSCFCGLNSIYSGKNCDSTAPMPKEECPLNCTPAKCVFSGFAERPYACLWNGIMRPVNGTTA